MRHALGEVDGRRGRAQAALSGVEKRGLGCDPQQTAAGVVVAMNLNKHSDHNFVAKYIRNCCKPYEGEEVARCDLLT